MKQHITKEQWNKLRDKDKLELVSYRAFFNKELAFNNFPSIGQMMEYLGNDIDSILKSTRWQVILEADGEIKGFTEEELVDALWMAIKYKLKQ